MSIIRYNPADYYPTSFSSLVDKFFNEAATRNGGSAFTPKVDVIENEKSYEVHVAAPGLSKDDFKVELNENQLTVSGERKFTNEENKKNYRSIETQYGKFSRSFYLPENADAEHINATYNNGILELTVPKDEKKALKQTIKVN